MDSDESERERIVESPVTEANLRSLRGSRSWPARKIVLKHGQKRWMRVCKHGARIQLRCTYPAGTTQAGHGKRLCRRRCQASGLQLQPRALSDELPSRDPIIGSRGQVTASHQKRSLRSALLSHPRLLRRPWLVDALGLSVGSASLGGVLRSRFGLLRFSPNMDGTEGEEHVHLGAKIMGLLFGDWWADFTLRHSRYWAKRNGVSVSKLCYADKLAFAMTPGWLYLPMA